jgi:hypothetical protein
MNNFMYAFLLLSLALSGCNRHTSGGWRQILADRLLLYGHRNWIVVADAAYPSQCRAGIETIVTGQDQISVLREVLDAISNSTHVRAKVSVDRELALVDESEAPGIRLFRDRLFRLPVIRDAASPLHEDLIVKMDEAAKTFHVLILKTTSTLPYTSVFFELDCKYWNEGAEAKLREALKEKP